MKQKLLSLFVTLISATSLFAYDCKIDGIYYNLNTTTMTAEVTNETGSYGAKSYSGSVIIPSSITYNSQTYSVTAIGEFAFSSCFGLTSVTIPNFVTTIGDYAFRGCRGLTSVTIPNSVTTIGYYAFYDCSGLTSITIPNSVTTIGNQAFENCTSLTSVTIPNSVTTIGNQAFENCTSLTSVTIPNSVTEIGHSAFEGCSGLASIDVDAANTHYASIDGVLFNYAKDTLIQYPIGNLRTEYIIPNSVTTIGGSAFEYCSGLTSITIPNSVTTIGGDAFYQCSGLTSITISNSVTTIGGWAFYECFGLHSVTIGNSVTTIGEDAFYRCTNLKTVYNDSKLSISKGSSTFGYVAYYADKVYVGIPIGDFVIKNGTILNGYIGTNTIVTIPNSVTTIGQSAFSNCSDLTSVTIPNSVTTIGGYAFFGCSGLTSIEIPNSVTTIGDAAFAWCLGLTSPLYNATIFAYMPQSYHGAYSIPNGIKQIIGYAFDGCSRLNLVTIPNSVTEIRDYTFQYCFGLTSVTIGNSVSKIGNKAFLDCNNITSVNWNAKNCNSWNFGTQVESFTFGNEVEIIPNELCKGMSKLASVVISNSVTTIGESAFEDCTYLKTITLGKSLNNIGCNAFKGDFRVEEITSYAEVTPNVCASTFDGLSKQYIYLYVPENSIRGYQVDPNWNGFDIRVKSADVTPMDDENPVVTPTDQDVTITWPITDGTDTYTLTITKNGEVVCVLTFNGNGQLTNIAFAAPGHNGAHQAPAAILTAQGYQFTVTGLNPGTVYDYSVTATDAGGQTLAEHKGNFSTTGGESDLQNVRNGAKVSKYFHNGNLIIERNGIKYTATGQKVR